jgi:hypothetical protein
LLAEITCSLNSLQFYIYLPLLLSGCYQSLKKDMS